MTKNTAQIQTPVSHSMVQMDSVPALSVSSISSSVDAIFSGTGSAVPAPWGIPVPCADWTAPFHPITDRIITLRTAV